MRFSGKVFIAVLSVPLAVALAQDAADPAAQFSQYRRDLEGNRNSSLAHFRIAEILTQEGDYQTAANELREALSGDLQPRWIEAWAHINLGKIYEATGQSDRAGNEYKLALETRDDANGASREATARLHPGDTISTFTAPQDPLSRTEPEYSLEARIAGLEGTVVVTAADGADQAGRPVNLRIERSLGLGLDEQARFAVQQWRFHPGAAPKTVQVDFSQSAKQSRWHLIGVDFQPPEGATRPTVLSAFYPSGAGVFTGPAIEEGRLLGAIGRQAFVALSFDVDENGVPTHVQADVSSDIVWNDQAAAVLRSWRFTPGMKDGKPVVVPCRFDFAWGPRTLAPRDIGRLVSALHAAPPPKTSLATPDAIYHPEPQYPQQALAAGIEGTVMVMLTIGDDGAPQVVRLMKGLGDTFDRGVLDTLRQWRFRLVRLNGVPAFTGVLVEVSFQLPDRVSSRILDPPRATARAQQ